MAIAASGGLQFLVPVAQALFAGRRVYVNSYGATAGLLVGFLVTVLFTGRFGVGAAIGLPGYHPAQAGMIGLVANALVALAVTAATRAKTNVKAEEYAKLLG